MYLHSGIQTRWTRTLLSLAIVILAIPVEAKDDRGDEDFANAFISDLAPLIALFGEQITKQYMSQTLYWSEHIILSMAPLGIMTAVVGAIRVGGPTLLKTIIGRARESRAAAEMELMSSTSHDVCEVWNGRQIVRLMGSSPVKQILYFPSRDDRGADQPTETTTAGGTETSSMETTTDAETETRTSEQIETTISEGTEAVQSHCGLYTLEEGVRTGLLKERRESSFIKSCVARYMKFLYRHRKSANDEESRSDKHLAAQQDNKAEESYPPNITLNLDVDPAKKRARLRFFAFLSVVVQGSVLLAESMIRYYPTLKLVKTDSPIAVPAFYLVIIGTVALTLGIQLCSYVVEQSTTERTWIPTDEKGFRIFWVQQAQDVNDQQFESHVLFATGIRTSIITSHPRQPYSTAHGFTINGISGENRDEGGKGVSQKLWKKPLIFSQGNDTRGSATETLTTIAAVTSIAGFILQFMGLRGMHWSATVCQVGAACIMTAVRALVRRDMADRPFAQVLPRGFELEWLATRLAADDPPSGNSSFWEEMDLERTKRTSEKTDRRELDDIWGTDYVHKGITSEFTSLLVSDRSETSSDAILVRKRLGELTGWKSEATDTARALEKATERVMNTLVEPSLGSYQRVNDSSCAFKLIMSLKQRNSKWKCNRPEMEAVLSLWLYALNGKPQGERKVQLLGPSTNKLLRDFSWWFEDRVNPIFEIVVVPIDGTVDASGASNAGYLDPGEVFTGRDIFGHQDERTDPFFQTMVSTETPRINFRTPTPATILGSSDCEPGNARYNTLASAIYCSTSKMCAMHLFSEFLRFVTRNFELRSSDNSEHETTVQDNGLSGQDYLLKLHNSLITELAQGVQLSGLCTEEEAHVAIVSALSLSGNLPKVEALIAWAREKALPYESIGNYKEASKIYLWLHRTCKTSGQDKVAIRALVILSEFARLVDNILHLSKKQLGDYWRENPYQELLELKGILDVELLSQTPEPGRLGSDNISALSTRQSSMRGRLKGWHKVDAVSEQVSMRSGSDLLRARGTKRLGDAKDALDCAIDGGSDVDESEDGSQDESSDDESSWEEVDNKDPLSVCEELGFTSWHEAAWLGGPHIKEAVSQSFAFHAVDIFGRTPLHYSLPNICAYLNFGEGIEELQSNTDLNYQDIFGFTALHYGSYCGDMFAVHSLLQRGAQPEIQVRDGKTALHLAAANGHSHLITILMEAGVSLEARDHLKQTALHCAGDSGSLDTVKNLVANGAARSARDGRGRTPLHHAITSFKPRKNSTQLLPIVRKLLGATYEEQLESMSAQDVSGQRALHFASEKGNLQVFQCLLEKLEPYDLKSDMIPGQSVRSSEIPLSGQRIKLNVDINVPDNDGRMALHGAASNGHYKVVDQLVKYNADVDSSLMIENKAGNGKKNWTALHLAVWGRHKQLVRLLIEDGHAKVNSGVDFQWTPLYAAIYSGQASMARMLIFEYGADVTSTFLPRSAIGYEDYGNHGGGWSSLHWAVSGGHESIVRMLVEECEVDVDTMTRNDHDQNTALMLAAKDGHENLVRMLLVDHKARADALAAGQNCRTALFYAAAHGHDKIVQMLLDKGKARSDLSGTDGFTPLQVASQNGHENVVRVLVFEGKADVELPQSGGYTPLISAVMQGHESTVRVLLEGNANANATNVDKGRDSLLKTPLHMAAEKGYATMARMLVVKGKANINAKDYYGRTPLELARREGHDETARVLIELAAEPST